MVSPSGFKQATGGEAEVPSAPPPPLPMRRNSVLRLFDAPWYRDWMCWMTIGWAVIAGASIGASKPTTGIPVWLNTLLAVIFFVMVLGVLPAWLRLVIRRWRWRRHQIKSEAVNAGALPSSDRSEASAPSPSPPARPRPRRSTEATVGRTSGVPPTTDARTSSPLHEARSSLQYPVARAARALQLASSPKEQYEALIDTAEALTITLGITAAGFFRSLHLGEQELSGLQAAYVTRGVAQGVWHDVINRLRRYVASNPDILPGARDALVDGGRDDPGIATDLATLLQERNRAAHGSRPRDRHEAAARIAELSIPLERALTKARFLADATWILTESSSYQPRTEDFTVSALHLMGDHPEFERHTFTTHDPLPDNACYALGPDGPFELSPFVVVRYCEFCRQEEIFHADRVQTKGTSLKSFGRGHIVFDHDISDELRQLI